MSVRHIWRIISGLWLVSVLYFLAYVNLPSMQTAINMSKGLSLLHGIMDLVLIGGGLSLIFRGVYWLSHRRPH